MTDVWELSAYVEGHPANHEQRWRLAKKLYTSWEYRLALEHLLILKNELEPRENVMRYLAATYYRLGRHDESIKALQDALELWPKDAAMREQLARTQAEAGQNEDALRTWRVLHKQEPQHPFAAQAIARLQKIVEKEANEKASAMQPVNTAAATGTGDAGAGPGTPKDVVCAKCGEKNTAEFKHCWKCNAQLTHSEDFLDGVVIKPERIEPARLPFPMGVGILIAALVALAAYFTMRGFAQVHAPGVGDWAPLRVDDFMARTLLWTRILGGAALLVVWPFAWRLSANLANVETRVYNESLYQSGALLALSTYALSWVSWTWIAAAVAVPVVVSALIAFRGLKLKPIEAAKLWAWQIGFAALLIALVVVGRHGPGLVLDATKIAAYARAEDPRQLYEGTLAAPGDIRVTWSSTGSPWLDRAAGKIRLTLEPAPHERRILLDTRRGENSLSFKPIREAVHSETIDAITPGIPYTFDVRSDDSINVGLTLRSLLPFTVELVSRQGAAKASP